MFIWAGAERKGEIMDRTELENKAAFELAGLYAAYGDGMVLRHVSLEAPVGRVTCLVGRNGAGKTTTLKAVMGLVKTPEGEILLDGKPVIHLPSYERAKRGIGYVPQGREIFPQLTVEENSSGPGSKEWERGDSRFYFRNISNIKGVFEPKRRGFIWRPAATAGNRPGRGCRTKDFDTRRAYGRNPAFHYSGDRTRDYRA